MHETKKQLSSIKRLCWISLFFFGYGAIIVPEWSNPKTLIGAALGFVGFLAIAAYSYNLQWRKRLTEKQLRTGLAQHKNFRTYLLFPSAALGILISRSLESRNLIAYAKGFVLLFMLLVSIFALMNIYAKKGFFQEKSPKRKSKSNS